MLKNVKNLLFIYKVLKIRLLALNVNNRNKINNIFYNMTINSLNLKQVF